MRPQLEIRTRSVPLIDIEVSRSGDGRTVTAYAATFDTPYEVRDFDGHYDEVITRTAFNRAIGRGVDQIRVLYNHGRTIWGTPSERYSMPLGTPIEVRAEARGLLTVTRYAKTPLADEVLELIREGGLKAMSWRGAITGSNPPRKGPNGRPVRERTQVGLDEYGPTPFPANNSAAILAVRNAVLAAQVGDLSEEERAELAELLKQTDPHLFGGSSVDPEPQEEPVAAPAEPAPAAPPTGPSVELYEAELAVLALEH